MEVCREFRENRKRWLRRYMELERRMTEAEQQQKWDRAERIGEALLEMEENSGFSETGYPGQSLQRNDENGPGGRSAEGV